MSLILTKSTPGHPASYVNRFKNTFEIKANAEIAVQEVVINRSKKFVVGPDARLYVRHGDATNVNLWNVPQMVVLVAGTYDPTEMAAHLQQQLNAYESHPQWLEQPACRSRRSRTRSRVAGGGRQPGTTSKPSRWASSTPASAAGSSGSGPGCARQALERSSGRRLGSASEHMLCAAPGGRQLTGWPPTKGVVPFTLSMLVDSAGQWGTHRIHPPPPAACALGAHETGTPAN